MEIEKINEKLETFASMVLKDAAQKASVLINEANTEKQKRMEEKEISSLKEAYRKIQDALVQIDKECNEIYSAKVFEAKQLLFKKRQEIVERVFTKVEERLENYRKTAEYAQKLKSMVKIGCSEVGEGAVEVLVDPCDLPLIEAWKSNSGFVFTTKESDEPLAGGCIILNTTHGILVDHSFKSRLLQQREGFLELSGMNIEL